MQQNPNMPTRGGKQTTPKIMEGNMAPEERKGSEERSHGPGTELQEHRQGATKASSPPC